MMLLIDLDNNLVGGIAKVSDIKKCGLLEASRRYNDGL